MVVMLWGGGMLSLKGSSGLAENTAGRVRRLRDNQTDFIEMTHALCAAHEPVHANRAAGHRAGSRCWKGDWRFFSHLVVDPLRRCAVARAKQLASVFRRVRAVRRGVHHEPLYRLPGV